MSARHGVVLVNVGTPEAPTTPAVRSYLREFLGDPRVIDLPALARWCLLNLVILPFRPRRSAHAYQQIWTPEGSPLLLNSRAQAAALQQALPGHLVVLAMRYGRPSLTDALETLKRQNVHHVTVVPMYPQYASATTGTTVEAWHRLLGEQVQPPASVTVPAFYADAGFIDASAERLKDAVRAENADFVLFSYHGLPLRQLAPYCEKKCTGPCRPMGEDNVNCYRAQCYATSAAIASAAGVANSATAFQSRLKGTTWLSPFTDEQMTALAKQGVKRLVISCPSFVADCLETLEEIGQRAKASFLAAGGESFALAPAVNAHPRFIEGLANLVRGQAFHSDSEIWPHPRVR